MRHQVGGKHIGVQARGTQLKTELGQGICNDKDGPDAEQWQRAHIYPTIGNAVDANQQRTYLIMNSSFGFILLALAIMLEIAGQLFFKAGVSARHDKSRADAQGRPMRDSNLLIAAGLMVYVVELVVWVAALSSLRLSQAFPLLSLSYAGVAIAAWLLFGEMPCRRSIIGIVLVTAGAALMVA